MKWAIGLLIGVAFLAGWVRLAPSSPDNWHIDPNAVDAPGMRGFLAQATFGDDPQMVLQKLNTIALATPRTRLLAGSVREGRVTYITRSFVWGFPDYTTVGVENASQGSRLTLYGRLRFGAGDTGVNRARIKSWLKRMDALKQ